MCTRQAKTVLIEPEKVYGAASEETTELLMGLKGSLNEL